MIRLRILILVGILLAGILPAAAQDDGQDVFIAWTISGHFDVSGQWVEVGRLSIAADLMSAALALDYVHHVEQEEQARSLAITWPDGRIELKDQTIVRIYYPDTYATQTVWWAVVRNLVQMYPGRWGHFAPFLPN